MKNMDLANLNNVLTSKELNNIAFSISANLAIQKNIQALKPIIAALANVEKKIAPTDPKFQEYTKKEKDLLSQYPHRQEGVATIFDDAPGFQAALANLQKDYSEILADYNARKVEWLELLNREEEVTLFKIKMSDLPATLEKGIFEKLYPILEE